jgi:D-alanyl-D-alanine carboxypeptidase
MIAHDLDEKLHALGITAQHRHACRMPLCSEPLTLADAGEDMFGRPQQMTEDTLAAWDKMKAAAMKDGIDLKLVSAYRSIDYQCKLIEQKLLDGRSLEDILCVNAIPGHSEHHTGCALDLHAGDGEPLTEVFEKEAAFAWLQKNAADFGFRMSYPKDNPEGIAYEPWHWCYRAT